MTFTEKINAAYTTANPHIYLGSGVLNNEILADARVNLPLKMMNRHGLIAGATGTGKTRTLQVLAEQLSDQGVPVFMLDVKGDLSGLNRPGITNPKLEERAKALGIAYEPKAFPVELYSLSGKLGAQMRATVIEFGPVMLGKILELNDTQVGVLAILFKYSDDKKMPLLDLSDLKKLLAYLSEGEGAAEIKADYGSISTSTSSTILRKIVALEQQGIGQIFGEKSFDIDDLFQKVDGHGTISLLNISDVQDQPAVFSTFLLSLLVEIYNAMPEAGDLDKPKLVFFFDEAHLLFNDAPKAFLDQINQIIRLIRSKGIGVFFCTQSPTDVPDTVLAQLGNRVQHALRAFTPNDAENLRKTVKTYPNSEFYEIDKALTSMGIGQALVTVLSEKGIPTEVAVTHLTPPRAIMGPMAAIECENLMKDSEVYGKYAETLNPESAYEILNKRIEAQMAIAEEAKEKAAEEKAEARTTTSGRAEKSAFEKIASNTMVRQIGREVVRGLFNMLLKSGKR